LSLLFLLLLNDLVVILEHFLEPEVYYEDQQDVGQRVPEVGLQVQLRFSTVITQPLWKGEKHEESGHNKEREKYEEGYPKVLDLFVRREEEEVHEEYDDQESEREPKHQVLHRFK